MADNAAIASNVVDEAIATLKRCRNIANPSEVVDDALFTLARCLAIASSHSDDPDAAELDEEPEESDDHHSDDDDDGVPLSAGDHVIIVPYKGESQLGEVKRLMDKHLPVPYPIYTYRYYIQNSPHFCLLAKDVVTKEYVGAIVCQTVVELPSKKKIGQIEMLAVDEAYRGMRVGSVLVLQAVVRMFGAMCDEVSLKTAVSNARLFLKLGFLKEKRLSKYYSSDTDSFLLKQYFSPPGSTCETQQEDPQEKAQ